VRDLSDFRRVMSALFAALLLALTTLDVAASANPLAPTSGSLFAIIDDGEDLEDQTSATLRGLSRLHLDGAALAAEHNQLSPAPNPAFSRPASFSGPAVNLCWHRPQTATGPPGHIRTA
jgi:hypothetical protein